MAGMTCKRIQAMLPDVLLDFTQMPAGVLAGMEEHLAACRSCGEEWKSLQATMQVLDMWEVPEPGPYFDMRLTANLREEKLSPAPGWLQRMRSRLVLGNLNLKPALAAAFALFLVSGVGSYEGFVSLNRTEPVRPAVSATVQDLQLFDSNAQTLQQLAAFDDTDAGVGQAPAGNASTY